jgi:2-polyprenyl-3-methyl-5-hydroxy-6-metoxy-1,4-benzoquinol methylase
MTPPVFEISQMRVNYGREMLGLDLVSDVNQLRDASFDIIYSAHVLEHIPNPAVSFRQFQRLLKPDGILFIYMFRIAQVNLLEGSESVGDP